MYSPQGEPQGPLSRYLQPQVEWRRLRPPPMVWVLAKILQKTRMERNRERFVLSSRDIRDYLGYSKSNRTSLSLAIREAIDWGVLSQATTGPSSVPY
ncbi:hypothetical protein [Acidilobus sp. 7A]|uniref:hypothetical protein n=1 Tax=Acidilobus sp. 7A TaxID=1577685 RepID=UPI000764D270|nr:hypothetical protein [Acidilobus sp. 7A]AMD30695.1 hypothetical protein SE86_04535 [Acidilobus sp. 7A]